MSVERTSGSYVAEVARLIKLEAVGDDGVPLNAGPYFFYAVLAFSKGQKATAEDVHDAWSAWKDHIGEAHPSLLPFNELSREVQQLDEPFMKAIHIVARKLLEG